MKKQIFGFLFFLIFSNAFSMETMEVLKAWAHSSDDKLNSDLDSNPYYKKVTVLISKDKAAQKDQNIMVLAWNKAISLFGNIDEFDDKNSIAASIVPNLPDTIENNELKLKAQQVFQTALTKVYREAKQKEALSKKDKDDSKTVSKPDSSSKK